MVYISLDEVSIDINKANVFYIDSRSHRSQSFIVAIVTWLTVTEYMCHKYQRKCSVNCYRIHVSQIPTEMFSLLKSQSRSPSLFHDLLPGL